MDFIFILLAAFIIFSLFCSHMASFHFGKSRAYNHCIEILEITKNEMDDEIINIVDGEIKKKYTFEGHFNRCEGFNPNYKNKDCELTNKQKLGSKQ